MARELISGIGYGDAICIAERLRGNQIIYGKSESKIGWQESDLEWGRIATKQITEKVEGE
ncbi:MAG: hypothetical protein GX998_11825 [Firmicutes bacterium]|nr:hypothetical protein [Bacillota bacterium]